MQPFQDFSGLVLPLDRANVDTDAIIPKQYLKSIRRSGLGPNLFDDWRYLDPGELGSAHDRRRVNPDFVLNLPRYRGASILLARENYGCGSSREHAVWAMLDYGLKAVVAPGFADIFHSNACKNGLLPVVLDAGVIEQLFRDTFAQEGYHLQVKLREQQLCTPQGDSHPFDVDPGIKGRLLGGLDDIAISLGHAEHIRAYEQRRRQQAPWLFPDLPQPP